MIWSFWTIQIIFLLNIHTLLSFKDIQQKCNYDSDCICYILTRTVLLFTIDDINNNRTDTNHDVVDAGI